MYKTGRPPLDPDFQATIDRWFAGKDFSVNFVKSHVPIWHSILAPRREEPLSILEIGCFEGRSTIFFLEYFSNSRITCIDSFDGGVEPAKNPYPAYPARFDSNLSAYKDRITEIRARSSTGLEMLRTHDERFDLIYVDGSHQRIEVLLDSVGAWFLLKVGGILIWDDYKLMRHLPSAERPMDAIDLFLRAFGGCYVMLHHKYQVIVRKSAEWPDNPQPAKRGKRGALWRLRRVIDSVVTRP